jgi:hypothetical protein
MNVAHHPDFCLNEAFRRIGLSPIPRNKVFLRVLYVSAVNTLSYEPLAKVYATK